jgi:hypothetical protein
MSTSSRNGSAVGSHGGSRIEPQVANARISLLLLAVFIAGALLPTPGLLVLAGLWVRGLQVSLLLASLVCIVAVTSPWWADWLEQKRIERVLRERGEVLP